MILSGIEIENYIKNGDIEITPFDKAQINPNSYNLRLYDKLLVYTDEINDMKKPLKTEEIIIPKNGLIIQPGKLYLGRTFEYTTTYKFVPMLEGRSSVGRLGIYIHIIAGFGDVGFSGYWTLEIQCIQAVKIYPMVEICQIYYHTISDEYLTYNSGKYQNNQGIQPSLFYKDFEEKKIMDELMDIELLHMNRQKIRMFVEACRKTGVSPRDIIDSLLDDYIAGAFGKNINYANMAFADEDIEEY